MSKPIDNLTKAESRLLEAEMKNIEDEMEDASNNVMSRVETPEEILAFLYACLGYIKSYKHKREIAND